MTVPHTPQMLRIAYQRIADQRLASQGISRRRFAFPVDAVRGLVAIQGQDYPGAKWSIGLRVPGSTDDQIEQAVADQQIIRTWLMRGTLHLAAPQDVPWLLDLLAPRQIEGYARRYKELELDEVTLHRSSALFVKALEKEPMLTRSDLRAVLEENGISGEGQRTPHMLHHASMRQLIWQGGMIGNDATFRLFNPPPDSITRTRDEALAELALRYFTSRGPATLADYIGWSGLTAGDARAGLQAVESQLEQDSIDGQTYYFASVSDTSDVQPDPSPTAYALPGFDEYILGYKNRDTVLDPQFAERICPGKNGIFYPTIVIDGRVVGTWKRTIKKKNILVEVSPFATLTDSDMQAFAVAVQRYGDYHGKPVELI